MKKVILALLILSIILPGIFSLSSCIVRPRAAVVVGPPPPKKKVVVVKKRQPRKVIIVR